MSKQKTTVSIVAIFTLVFMIASYHIVHHRVEPQSRQTLKINGFVLPEKKLVQPFTLTDDQGQAFTEQSLQGQWHLLFFGFTHCGFVCPTTLAELNKMYQQLIGRLPHSLLPQVVMVSVDPERDTVARLHEYVQAFNPHFKGVGGAGVKDLQDQFHVIAVKILPTTTDSDNKDYTINHSSEIIVTDPQGRVRAFLSYPHEALQMVHDYSLIVRQSS